MGSRPSTTRTSGPGASGAQQQPEVSTNNPDSATPQENHPGEGPQESEATEGTKPPTMEEPPAQLTREEKEKGKQILEDFCEYLGQESWERSLPGQIELKNRELRKKFDEAHLRKDDYLLRHVAGLNFTMKAVQFVRVLFLVRHQSDNVPCFLQKNDVQVHEKVVLVRIRMWLANFSDGCAQVRRDIGRTNYLEELLREIQYVCKEIPGLLNQEDNLMKLAMKTAFIILHNCAKEKDNQKYFQKNLLGNQSEEHEDGVSVLSATMNTGHSTYKAFAAMTLCYVVSWRDPQVHQLSKDVLTFIIEACNTALNPTQATFDKLELCDALLACADVESNRKQIVDEGGLKPLGEILAGNELPEKVAAIKVLQKLALEPTREKVKADETIMKVLRNQQSNSDLDLDFRRRVRKLLEDLEDLERSNQ